MLPIPARNALAALSSSTPSAMPLNSSNPNWPVRTARSQPSPPPHPPRSPPPPQPPPTHAGPPPRTPPASTPPRQSQRRSSQADHPAFPADAAYPGPQGIGRNVVQHAQRDGLQFLEPELAGPHGPQQSLLDPPPSPLRTARQRPLQRSPHGFHIPRKSLPIRPHPHDQIVDLLVHPDPQKNTLKNKVRCEGRGPVQTLELNSRPFHHPRSFRSLRLSACGRRP